jgi:hypothetical protein
VSVRPTIYLALTDDWELRGNGSGDIEKIQLRPMRELVRLYKQHGVRGTFNAEVMQQLAFRRLQDQHAELKLLADAWDEHVREAFKQGHDIQLHVHTQWSDARYEDGHWRLAGDWSILEYEPDAAFAMLSSSKEYLENLLRPIDSAYRCVAFRAGASCIAPSPFALGLLARLGIVFDLSIVGGLRVETRNLQMDYTNCEETFLPFYPRMDDARKVSDKEEPIVCVPVHHFYGSRPQVFLWTLSTALRKSRARVSSITTRSNGDEASNEQEWADTRHASRFTRLYEKAVRPCFKGKHLTSDLGKLNRPFMREMLRAIRRQAQDSGLQEVPVILTNHSKYITDYAPIESFLSEASQAEDIKFLTLTELAEKLRAGEFPIRKNSSAAGQAL